MHEQTTSVAPISKSVVVPRTQEDAFRLFTEGLATWWPLRTHSITDPEPETAVFEPRVGGRLYERTSAGEELLWGTVTVWEPPDRLAYTWHPGRGEETAQEVEIRFLPVENGTRLELEHRGWERAPERRRGYDEGWDTVLGRYAETAAA
jgi:uncharacterized protein YndB with AHSA1/START domain